MRVLLVVYGTRRRKGEPSRRRRRWRRPRRCRCRMRCRMRRRPSNDTAMLHTPPVAAVLPFKQRQLSVIETPQATLQRGANAALDAASDLRVAASRV